MIRQTITFIAVLEVIRDMGIEPTDKLCWSVGNTMQAWFVREFGAQPWKDLHTKKNGGGSHCMAYYPEKMRLKIEEFVKMCKMEAARQPSLFSLQELVEVPRRGVVVELIV